MPGLGLLLKLVRLGVAGPVEQAGFFPSRYYLARALDALEADDLGAAVAALEARGGRLDASRQAALVREQVVFRIRTVAEGHRTASARAEARADYLEGLAASARRRLERTAARRRVVAAGTAVLALAAASAALAAVLTGPADLSGPVAPRAAAALLAAAVVLVVALAALAASSTAALRRVWAAPADDEPGRLDAAARVERRHAAAEAEAASALGALEARLARASAAPRGPIVVPPGRYRRADDDTPAPAGRAP